MHVADTLARSASPRNPNTSRSRCAGSFSMSSHGPSTTNGASCIMHGDVERVIRPSFVRFQRALSALIISPRAGECLGARLFRPKSANGAALPERSRPPAPILPVPDSLPGPRLAALVRRAANPQRITQVQTKSPYERFRMERARNGCRPSPRNQRAVGRR